MNVYMRSAARDARRSRQETAIRPLRRRSALLVEMPPPLTDPAASAQAVGLRYVSDSMPGIRRLRAGRGFRYLGPDGQPIRQPDGLARIRALAIPPAWTQVWICLQANGHIQATGQDARRRKQYRYHSRWREARDETKYHRIVLFGRALPLIRQRTEQDLALPGLPREKVLAAVVRLLEMTSIRVGNDEYARTNHSFGLTTLRAHHVDVNGTSLRFTFRGKSGVRHAIDLRDRRLAKIVKQCQDLPGHELFQYLDDEGERRTIDSTDVNDFLRTISGQDFSAKDFRTWNGTVLAACALRELAFASETEAKRNVNQVIAGVAAKLGNTRTICRKCYVHPAVIELYMAGGLAEALAHFWPTKSLQATEQLQAEEAAVLALLMAKLADKVAAQA